MRRRILPLMLLLALCAAASAQIYDEEHEADDFTLDKPLKSNKSYHYTASSVIDLIAGFNYTPNKGMSALFETNPMGVFPPEEGVTTNAYVNYQYEDAGVVSSINGSINVSSLGGALYTVPIELPLGINGMQPDLSVVYNSQAGNGLFGYGWNLAGVSSITRTGSTLYHDGKMTAADFSDDDRFLLDGQRLIECGTSGDTVLYKTEQDVFSKILFYGKEGSSVFKVMNEDGTISIYGGCENSKLLAQNRNAVIEWKIYTTSDRNGNTITYNYSNSRNSGEINIDYIEYTGNNRAGISPAFRVEFEYKNDRDDQYHYYIAGNKVQYKKAIEKISIRKGRDVVCCYGFKYGFYKFLKLVKITKVKDGV